MQQEQVRVIVENLAVEVDVEVRFAPGWESKAITALDECYARARARLGGKGLPGVHEPSNPPETGGFGPTGPPED